MVKSGHRQSLAAPIKSGKTANRARACSEWHGSPDP